MPYFAQLFYAYACAHTGKFYDIKTSSNSAYFEFDSGTRVLLIDNDPSYNDELLITTIVRNIQPAIVALGSHNDWNMSQTLKKRIDALRRAAPEAKFVDYHGKQTVNKKCAHPLCTENEAHECIPGPMFRHVEMFISALQSISNPSSPIKTISVSPYLSGVPSLK